MKRIDLISKEETIEILKQFYPEYTCEYCPIAECEECHGEKGCFQNIHDYLFTEVEMVCRADLYKNAEEALSAYRSYAGSKLEFTYADVVSLVKFLLEKVPKTLDKSPKV